MAAYRKNTIEELSKYFKTKPQKKYYKSDILLHQEDLIKYVYFVKSGFIRFYDIDSRGNQKLVMIVGEVNLFPGSVVVRPELKSSYYWEAMTDVVLYRVDTKKFQDDLIANSQLGLELFSYVVNTVMILDGRVRTLLQTYAAQRIPSTIKHLVDYAGHIDEKGLGHLDIIISHQDIAALANVARETASIEIKKMKDKQIIWYEGHKMLIDLSRLVDLA